MESVPLPIKHTPRPCKSASTDINGEYSRTNKKDHAFLGQFAPVVTTQSFETNNHLSFTGNIIIVY